MIRAVCLFLLLLSSARASELTLNGRFIQGGLVIGQGNNIKSVSFGQRQVRLSPDGYFLFGFGRDEPESVTLNVTYRDNTSEQRRLTIKQRRYTIQHVNGLPPQLVTPDEATLERRLREAQLVKQARKRDAVDTRFLESFIWPAEGKISGVYGSQRVLNGQPRRPHFGLDIAAPVGKPVVAPAGGTVTLVHNDMYYSGGTLIVDHGHGLSSTFIHLNKIDVAEGEIVTQGQKIAEIGQTGRATGPHLDWRINWFERRLDPQLLVSEALLKP